MIHRNPTHYGVLALIAIFLVAIGCSGGTSNVDPGDRVEDFASGTDALVMKFEKDAPPRQLYNTQNTVVALKIQNKGVAEIRSGFLSFSYDRAIFDFTEEDESTFRIEGKSTAFPKGEIKILTFPVKVLPLVTESQTHEAAFTATACYVYKTQVRETVCIDTDPFDVKAVTDDEVCKIKDVSPGSSGAPLSVTKIKVQMLPDGDFLFPHFLIEIPAFVKPGITLFDSDVGVSYCRGNVQDYSETINVVQLKAELSDVPLLCDRETIQLTDKPTTISCKAASVDPTILTFEAPIYIELSYGISQSTSHKVEITR